MRWINVRHLIYNVVFYILKLKILSFKFESPDLDMTILIMPNAVNNECSEIWSNSIQLLHSLVYIFV